MTTIFCSNKLGNFLGKIESELHLDDGESKFGNWNGHLFIIERKKYILFTNDKTAYSFVVSNIKKADLKDFFKLFRESLITQLDHDLRINERQEIQIRNSLKGLRITKTNNNRKILGTMNEFVLMIKHAVFNQFDPGRVSTVELGFGLNNYFIGTKLEGATQRYSVPKELMLKLLQ